MFGSGFGTTVLMTYDGPVAPTFVSASSRIDVIHCVVSAWLAVVKSQASCRLVVSTPFALSLLMMSA